MFVHSSRIKGQLDYLRSIGIDIAPVFSLASLDKEEVSDPGKTFSFEQYQAVIKFALERTGDEYFGLKLGREPHIAGTVGMMSASCRNFREALIQGCKYFKVQGNFAEIEFLDDQSFPRVRYRPDQSWVLQSQDTARQEVDAMFSFLVTVLDINSNHTLSPFRITLTRQPPEWTGEYEHYLKVIPVFGQKENELIFRAHDLHVPMKAFNPELFELLRSHVENQLRKYSNHDKVSEKVRSILLSSLQYTFPDIEAVSSRLNMSSRTLQRMLAQENTNFKSLLLDTRFDLAKQFLIQGELNISEIAYTLGYSDLANFSRSFKKFEGISPQQYRNQYQSSDE